MRKPHVIPDRKTCPACGENKASADFARRRLESSGSWTITICLACHSDRLRKKYATNKVAMLASQKASYLREGPEQKARRRAHGRNSKARLKAEVFAAYGNRCACCGEHRREFLSIDHIDGKGVEHRKIVEGWRLYTWLRQNGFPKDNFRILCMNCNFSRGKYGNCPHEVEAYELPFAVRMEA